MLLLAALALLSLPPAGLRFEVRLDPAVKPQWSSGRMLLVLGPTDSKDPRRSIGETGMDNAPILGCDVAQLEAGTTVVLDEHSVLAPIANLAALPAGDYNVQAVFRCNPDLRLVVAPGNLFSEPQKVHLDPASATTVTSS